MSELQLEGQGLQIGAKLSWELTAAELIFPFDVTIGSRVRPIYVHMKQYRAADLKDLLASINYRVRSEGSEREIVKGGKEKLEEFFWKYFSRLSSNGEAPSSSDPSPDSQKEWIKKNPRHFIPRSVVLDGFGKFGVKPRQKEDESSQADADLKALLAFDGGETITLIHDLYVSGAGIVELEMTHNFRRETISECHRYDKATDQQKIHKDSAFERTTNYDVLEHLYDALIVSIDGMTIKGQACQQSNKEEWVKLVPFWHKFWAITEFFSGIESKNA